MKIVEYYCSEKVEQNFSISSGQCQKPKVSLTKKSGDKSKVTQEKFVLTSKYFSVIGQIIL